jgi:hypothetical protein
MNGSRRKASVLVLAALGGGTIEAQACGELMLRGLGTMRFHAFATHSPANILLYSGTAAINSKAPAATDARLYDSLKRVGHKVTLARGPGELEQALATSRFDVMIAYANDMVSASPQLANASREPTLIPVLHDLASEREMRERYPRLVTGNFNQLLKAIEQAMSPAKA